MKTKFYDGVIIYQDESLDVEPVNLSKDFIKSPYSQPHVANDGIIL